MSADVPQRSVEALLAEREWVRSLARSLVADENLAADVEQETWLAATSRPPADLSSPRAWLGTVLRNFVRRDARGAGRRALRESASARGEAMPSASEMVARAETHRRVVDAVLGLPEPYRATVLARFFEDLPPREIARQMQVPVETVRTRLKRAISQLRERLDAEHGGDGRAWGIALLPLAAKGGLVVKTSTKTGIAAALLLACGGATALLMTKPWSDDATVALAPAPDVAPVAAPVAPAVAAPAAAPEPAPPAGTASVRGEVWFADPEKPAPGVAVSIGPAGATKVVRTDDAGRFRLDGLATGFRGSVRVRHETSAECVRTVMPLREGEVCDVGLLRITAPASADVVVRTFDGKPVEGAEVRAWRTPVRTIRSSLDDAEWRDSPDPDAHGVTDSAGRVRLTNLEPDAWTFGATKREFAVTPSSAVPLVAGQVAGPIVLHAQDAPPLTGRVVDREGRGVAGVVVWAQTKSGYGHMDVVSALPHATSGADGAFEIDGLVPAAYDLRVQRGATSLITAATVRVPASAPVEIRLAGRRIVGHVRDAAGGAPIAGARVSATMAGLSFSAIEATSSADGSFVLDTVVDTPVISGIRVTRAGFVEVPDPVRTKNPDQDPGLWLRASGDTPLELLMRRGARLSGRVASGAEPVRGARMFLHRYRAAPVQTLSDSEGRYEFDGVERGSVMLQVLAAELVQSDWSYDDYGRFVSGQPAAAAVTIPETGEVVRDIAMEACIVVAGRVLGPDGAPVAGAEVMGNNMAQWLSGADGSFRVLTAPFNDKLFVVARHPAIGSGSFSGPVPADRRVEGAEIRLKAAPRLTGKVTDSGAAGAWVQWATKPQGDWEPWWGNSTPQPVAADGTFDLAVFESDAIVVRAGAPGFPVVTTIAARRTDGSYAAELTLERGVRLAGRVVVAGTREPIAGAEVLLIRGESNSIRTAAPLTQQVVAAVSASDGRFAVDDLPSGPHLVRVQLVGYAAIEREVTLPADGDVVFEIARGAAIAGRVTFSDGTPVVRASISAKFAPDAAAGATGNKKYAGFGKTDEDGHFTVDCLPPGTYDLLVSRGMSQDKFDNAERAGVAAGTNGVDFVVEKKGVGLRMSGRVVGEDGAPIGSAHVSAEPSSGRGWATATAGSDGRFVMEGLEGVTYRVHASPPQPSRFVDIGVATDGRWLSGKTENVTPPRDDVVVTLPLGETIEGVVVDAAGAPVPNVWVSVGMPPSPDDIRARGSPGPLADATDADGHFEITGLRPGITWRLVEPGRRGVRDPAPFVGGEAVKSGTRGLRLTLGSFAKIRGVVVDAAGAPVVGAKVGAYGPRGEEEQTSVTGADGAFSLGGLDAGARFDVVAWTESLAPTTLSAVNAGAEGLRLELREGVVVTGRLLGKDGKPLASTKLVLRTSATPVSVETMTDRDGRFTAKGLLARRWRAAYVGLVDHMYREISCGEVDAPAENVELRVP